MDLNIRNCFPVRFAATFGLVLVLSGFCAGSALANVTVAASGAGNTTSASATVKFRIVVAETIRLSGEQQRQAATAPATSRTVTIRDGHQLVTLARP